MSFGKSYDFIITGGGASGLSLLVRMAQDSWFDSKRILLIDQEPKDKNDRTWCFWEETPNIFEEIVFHRWDYLMFFAHDKVKELDIKPYQYKMIRGLDFYNYCYSIIKDKLNIEVKIDKVINIENLKGRCLVKTQNSIYSSTYVFNSIIFKQPEKSNKYHFLLQHFKGWIIETKVEVFDPKVAGFMDFRVPQEEGTTFVYVLPFTTTKALIEYTYFTKNILDSSIYDENLNHYINNYLDIHDFKIHEVEYGVIPMTNFPFPLNDGNIINMGTAGRFTKASSGFTFRFIQKNAEKIINDLKKGKFPVSQRTFRQKMFGFYDSTMLNVLQAKKTTGKEVFTQLFENCKAHHVLEFLDNEGAIFNDIKIMKSVPKALFTKAGIKEMMKNLLRK